MTLSNSRLPRTYDISAERTGLVGINMSAPGNQERAGDRRLRERAARPRVVYVPAERC